MKKTIQILAIIIAVICSDKINAQCTANAGPDQFFCCGGGTTTLNATFSSSASCTCSFVTYTWTPSTGLSNPHIASPTATISNITYTVCISAHTGFSCSTICCTACDVITLHVGGVSCCRTTGVESLNANPDFINVYPNPAKTLLTLDIKEAVENAEMNLYDITGKIVWKKENINGVNKFEVNVSTFPRGVYFVKTIEKGKDIYTGKILLE